MHVGALRNEHAGLRHGLDRGPAIGEQPAGQHHVPVEGLPHGGQGLLQRGQHQLVIEQTACFRHVAHRYEHGLQRYVLLARLPRRGLAQPGLERRTQGHHTDVERFPQQVQNGHVVQPAIGLGGIGKQI